MGRETPGSSRRAETVHPRKPAGERVVCRAARGKTESGPHALETPRRMPESIPAPPKLHRRRGKTAHRRTADRRPENFGSRRVAGLSAEAHGNTGRGAAGSLCDLTAV